MMGALAMGRRIFVCISSKARESRAGNDSRVVEYNEPGLLARFLRHRPAACGTLVLILLALLAALAPRIWGDAIHRIPTEHIAQQAKLPPSWQHPFGTDELGRDVLARTLYGGRVSLLVGLTAAAIATSVGSLVGAAAGYYGGLVDSILMRCTEVVATLPFFFLVLTVVAFTGNSFWNVVTIIGLTGWTSTARLVRGQFLQVREQEFVQAARALGAGDARIIFGHILPNVLAVVIVNATLAVAGIISLEAALSFFGLGVPTTTPTWGNMLTSAQQYLYRAAWLAIFPGLMILLTVMSINFVGDGLRDAFDPRLKQ